MSSLHEAGGEPVCVRLTCCGRAGVSGVWCRVFFAALLLCWPLWACQASGQGRGMDLFGDVQTSEGRIIGEKDTGSPVRLQVGEEFTITLESNPTTGYGWQLTGKPNPDVVRHVSNEFKGSETGMLGAGGMEWWKFRTVGQGKTVLSFEYLRPWEKGEAPIRKIRFTVVVR
ncbi:MAG: protease inhibitor I42 family protein [Syntrophobacteraceae bacterium]|nr:protease inhibitor I42 family protein [Syntrophobacteraceae bacterium]